MTTSFFLVFLEKNNGLQKNYLDFFYKNIYKNAFLEVRMFQIDRID